MVGMALEQAPGAIDGFGDNHPNEAMWQRQRRQGPTLIGTIKTLGGNPVGPANQQGHRTAALKPALEPAGKLGRAPTSTRLVQSDDMGTFWQGCHHALTFLLKQARQRNGFAAFWQRYFGQRQRAASTKPSSVRGET